MSVELTWFGHDSFRINGELRIYIDPWQLPANQPPADVVLITHSHQDHLSVADLTKLRGDQTRIIGPETVRAEAKELPFEVIKPGQQIQIDHVCVQAVPAYNLNKFREPGLPFHPKEAGFVGYIVELDGKRIYHPGDTDAIPELAEAKDVDVFLVPVSGTYVMTADEAAEAVKIVQPKLAIPMHWGTIVGEQDDAEKLASLVEVPTRILKAGETIEI